MTTHIITALFLLVAISSINAQDNVPQCSNDPCFVQANVPDACCVLDDPSIIALAGVRNPSNRVLGQAIKQYVQTVCTPTCKPSIFGAYRQCLQSAPIDQSLVQDYMPANLCDLTCLVEEEVDFDDITNCEQYSSITPACLERVVRVEGIIGFALTTLVNNCTVEFDDMAPAPAPSVAAFSGPSTTANKTQPPANEAPAAPASIPGVVPVNSAYGSSARPLAWSVLGFVVLFAMLL